MVDRAHDEHFCRRLVVSIRLFGESKDLKCNQYTGLSLIEELKNNISNPNNEQEVWRKIHHAHKAFTKHFIGLLLILHPQTSTEKSSEDVLIQDGVQFMKKILSQLYIVGLKNELKPWKKPPHKCFDISHPSTLLHYTSKLPHPSRISLKALWDLWKRWFRVSTYPTKTFVSGLTEFGTVIERNLILKSKSCPSERTIELEGPSGKFAMENPQKRIPDQAIKIESLRWRRCYRPAIHIGKVYYELLTLRVEADEYFDPLDEELKSKCLLNDLSMDSTCVQKVDLFVRKLYYELTPCFLGCLVALYSGDDSNQCLEGLIDNGWKFFWNFLDLLNNVFSCKDLEGIEIMKKQAVDITLSVLKRGSRSEDFSLENILILLRAWLNQSSYPNKEMVNLEDNESTLLRVIHDRYQVLITSTT